MLRNQDRYTFLRNNRHSRRVLFRVKRLRCRTLLASIFRAWKEVQEEDDGGVTDGRLAQRIKGLALTEGRVVLAIWQLTTDFKRLASRDAAEHTRISIEEAKGHGPAELARLLRGILKTGRRYRAPRVQQVLEEEGRLISDYDEITATLEKHFAKPEHGTPIATQQLLVSTPPIRRQGKLHARHLPTLPDLVLGLQALQHGKAPGVTGIPAEAYSQVPLEAGLAVYPIYIKSAVRGQVPLVWRGTQSVALHKPGKPAWSLNSWRNIALHDVCAKGIGKAVRSMLCPALARLSTKGQHGALAKQDIGAPSHYVQCYVRLARAKSQSGAVVFLDGQSAYYSVLRQLLFPLDSADEEQALRALLASLQHTPAQQDAVLAALAGPGLLASGGVPEGLVQFLSDSLTNSWFGLDPHSGRLHLTATGSVPGTPTADVLF